jgi:hypothetical protein
MAVGFPVKDDYATGDVLTAANMNDLAGTLNTVPSTIGAYAAGKSKIINGDFRINQRAFTTTTSSSTFIYDRFQTRATDGTTTFTANTFTAGTAPITSNPALNYLTIQTTGQTLVSARSAILQKIEDVRTLSNQSVTMSFYAKASAGTPSVAANVSQIFGTSGSATVDIAGQKTAITTSWARYSFTFTIPSVSGKTITSDSALWAFIYTSAGSDFNTVTNSLGIQTATIDIWGVQLEAGSIATPFQTASGSIAGELALCQRYLPAMRGTWSPINGFATSTTSSFTWFTFPVTPRVVPTGITVSNVSHFQLINAAIAAGTPTAIAFDSFNNGLNAAGLTITTTAASPTLVQGQGVYLRISDTSGSILFTGCEL